MTNASGAKRQREKDRAERAALKRDKRIARELERVENPETKPDSGPQHSEEQVLAALAALHARFDAGSISLDDFEVAKTDLIGRLHVQ